MTEPTAPDHRPSAEAPRGARGRTALLITAAMAAGALAGTLALYGIRGQWGNAERAAGSTVIKSDANAPRGAGDSGCADAVRHAARLKGLATGEIAALSLAQDPRRIPDLSFTDAEGRPVSLADFKGKTLLVNLWATWCVPCRKEMPALDRLQQTLGGPAFEVVAINLDTRDPTRPQAFLKEIGVTSLAFFSDPANKSFQALRTAGRGFGLPTTLLVDAQGCELGFLAGPAEWSSEDAKALIKAAIAG